MEYITGLELGGSYICHSGVKGMKWGVRKRKPPTGNRVKKTAFNRRAFEGKKKNISMATDDELNSYAKRMELEKRVLTLQSELTKMTSPPKKVSAGKQLASKIWKDGIVPGLADAAKQTTTKMVAKAVDSLLAKNNTTARR